MRTVTQRRARAIATAGAPVRCSSCLHPRKRTLTPEESRRYGRWWLDRYTDRELADFALALGVQAARAENVAHQRATL